MGTGVRLAAYLEDALLPFAEVSMVAGREEKCIASVRCEMVCFTTPRAAVGLNTGCCSPLTPELPAAAAAPPT